LLQCWSSLHSPSPSAVAVSPRAGPSRLTRRDGASTGTFLRPERRVISKMHHHYDDLLTPLVQNCTNVEFVANPHGRTAGNRARNPSTLELSSLDGTNGFQIDGEAAYDLTGGSVSSAGDVNGFDDLVVGANLADPNGSKSGASYVIFGRAPDSAVTRTGTGIGQTIHGGAFGDTLDGAGGADTLVGGGDTIVEDNNAGTDTVKSSVTYVLGSNFEKLILTGSGNQDGTGNAADNTLIGNSGNNTLYGSKGNDRLDGGTGTDTMAGGKGNDIYVIDVKGDVVTEAKSAGSDTVRTALNSYTLGSDVENLTLSGKADLKGTGNTLANVLTGNSGDNRLYGLGGNDTLNGGSGKDMLTGGTGADTFVFALGDTSASRTKTDTILDMTKSDHIDLHLIDANEDKSGNQKFDFIGTDTFSGHAGELRYEKTGSDTWIYGDTDGDRKIDFTVHLDDAVTLKADYFML
jgi:Ca2+-binding RTX toxin-like protein